jgi:dTDP-4-amino-4,6-dideoxygalactose transaminase
MSAAATGPPVPFVDLARQYGPIRDEARAAFERLASAGSFMFGEEHDRFEAEWAEYCGAGHAVGVADGTEALRLGLVALGAGPGREVVTVPHTFVASVEAIVLTGARPVLVDVDPATRCIDPGAARAAVGEATVAVVPVHLYGRPAPLGELVAACPEVPLLEDSAQAHGARLAGRPIGGSGHLAAFSFYPTKNLGAMGDAGALTCDDAEVAETVRSLRFHGSAPGNPNRHERVGSTGRLDTLQAAMLRLKLRHLDEWNDQRRAAAGRYRELLADLPLTLPPEDPDSGHQVFHLYVVEVDDRDRVLAELRGQGVGAAVHYPTPVHLQPAYRELGHAAGDFPAAERLAARCLSLPMFPGITEEEIERTAGALRMILSSRQAA